MFDLQKGVILAAAVLAVASSASAQSIVSVTLTNEAGTKNSVVGGTSRLGHGIVILDSPAVADMAIETESDDPAIVTENLIIAAGETAGEFRFESTEVVPVATTANILVC